MAVVCLLRTSGLILLFLINTLAISPWLTSVKIDKVTCTEINCDYRLKVIGDVNQWSLTSNQNIRGAKCDDKVLIQKSNVIVEFSLPVSEKLYFCVEKDGVWYHQGKILYLFGDDVTGLEP